MKIFPRFPHTIVASFALALLVAGCTTGPMPDASYHTAGYGDPYRGPDPGERGELTEFDVLGIEPGAKVTEDQITRALDAAARVRMGKGTGVLLIRSGASAPNPLAVAELASSFAIVPFSGQRPKTDGESYSMSLRLVAAQAACESIVCYWETLESSVEEHHTKILSWVPLIGDIVPDRTQHLRLRLKVALLDVRTGNWALLTPEVYTSQTLSAKLDRAASDQTQVENLRKLAYETAMGDLKKRYAD